MSTERYPKLPDSISPTIEELPGELSQLARYIEEVVPGRGVDVVLHLEQKYRSTYIFFHTLQKFREKIRNQWIVDRYDNGEKVADIARDPRVDVGIRQVWNILGREPCEDKQMRLF